jgi:hypothetical protein
MHLPADSDLRAAAAALGSAFPVTGWPERCGVGGEGGAGDEPWCVALSGGADSVAVLLTLVGLRTADCGLRNDRTMPEPGTAAQD